MSDRATLKAFFETGDFPTEAQFADLIDSVLVPEDDGDGAIGLHFAKEVVTTAQLKAINTTPQIIAAAPGATKVNVPIMTGIFYDFNTTAYATGGQFLGLYETDELGLNWVTYESAITPLLTETNDVTRIKIMNSGALDSGVNKAIVLTMPSADPTLGDSPVTVALLYRIFDFS